ncbi:hypothetical protein KEF85_08435 [Methylomonas paludis]|uniref:Uncharacterized protein n=1 Tax=Methylomonas paludis TaxID=1173101 RepID=A0A975R8R9_9GAMM|nr:hypothetical protein [Methylomonas paludis]QWF69411.1 hypothetical protein KEF85_08435 [Methylomonas paludis]
MNNSILNCKAASCGTTKLAVAITCMLLLGGLSISSAWAEHGNDHGRGGGGEHHEDHDHGNWRGGGYGYGNHYGYGQGYGYGYAQPVYVPPPVYAVPIQSPGINLIVPLNFR